MGARKIGYKSVLMARRQETQAVSENILSTHPLSLHFHVCKGSTNIYR